MAEQTPAPSWPSGDDPGVPSHLIPEPPDGSIIQFESPGRDVHAAWSSSASSVAAGWEPEERWLYYGKTIPQTWEELMEDFGGEKLSRFVFLTPAPPSVRDADSPAPADVDPGEAAAYRVGYETGRDAGIAEGRRLAAEAIEEHAESIGWYEDGGTWAEAVELARGKHITQSAEFRERYGSPPAAPVPAGDSQPGGPLELTDRHGCCWMVDATGLWCNGLGAKLARAELERRGPLAPCPPGQPGVADGRS